MTKHKTIELCYGAGIVQRFEQLRDELFSQPIFPSAQHWLMLVPTHRRARALRETFYLCQPATATCEPLIFSMHELIRRLAPLVPEQRRVISDAAQEMLIDSILRRSQQQLRYFRPAPQGEPFPGLVKQLARLFSALTELQHTAASLRQLASQSESDDATKLDEIITIFAQYESLLTQRGLADQPLWESLVVAAATPDQLRAVFPALQTVIIDGFDVFAPSLLKLIEVCAEVAGRVEIFLAFDPDRSEIFLHVAQAFTQLQKIAGRTTRLELPYGATKNAPLTQALFASRRPPAEKIPPRDFIQLFPARDRRDEVERIARWIKSTALEAESDEDRARRLRQIGVTFAQLATYAPLVREIFADYGIPYRIAAGISLAQSPVVRSILDVLNVVHTNYHRKALLRLINSPYIRLAPAAAAQPTRPQEFLSAEVLNTLSIRLFIVDGKDNWIERLEHELRRSDLRARAASEGYEETDEEAPLAPDRDALVAQRTQIIASLEGLRALFAILEPLESPGTLADFRQRLLKILDDLGFSSLILSRETGILRLNTLRLELASYRRFLEILDELVSLEPHIGRGEMTLDGFERLLRWALESATLPLPDEEPAGIQVMGKLEPRGMRFDYLIVGGLVEGEFPAQPEATPFFTSQQLAALGLRHPRFALSEERFLFSLYLAETNQRVVLTYPLMEGDEVLLRSSFIDEIERITALEEQPCHDAGAIYSTRELQCRIGDALARSPAALNESPQAALLRSYASSDADPAPEKTLRDAARRVNVVLLRERTADLSEYDGTIANPALRDEIAQRITERIYSVSQLEEYARCPFLFFCRRLLGVEPLEELEEELTPLERGSLLHEILFRFYTARRDRGEPTFRTPEEIERARAELLEIAQDALKSYAFRGILWEIEKERMIGGTGPLGRAGVLQCFLELDYAEFAGKPVCFEPQFFEVSFGRLPESGFAPDPLSSNDPFIIERNGERLQLRGKIDRIDILGDAFAVVDYKSGKSVQDISKLTDEGLALQLPIYLLAARNLLRRHFRAAFATAAALYFILHDDADCDKKIFLFDNRYRSSIVPKGKRPRAGKCDSPEELEAYLECACDLAIGYVRAMKLGRFHPTVRNDYTLCDRCDYKYVCRVNSARMQLLKDRLQTWQQRR